MTVSSELSAVTRDWTGAETVFTTGFKAADPTFVKVSTATAALTRGTHYTSSIDVAGLLVVTPLAGMPAAPQTLLIERDTTIKQDVSLENGADFDAPSIERLLDRVVMTTQENKRRSLAAETDAASAVQTSSDALATAADALATVEDLVEGLIPVGSITNARMADVPQATVKMRPAGLGNGPPIDGTIAELRALLGNQVTKNLFPNSQWLVATGLNGATRYDAAGAAMGTVNVSSYTTGANTVVCLTADTSQVVLGGIIVFNAPADIALRNNYALRVVAVVPNTSFTVILPFGLTASASTACTAQMWERGGSASAGTGDGFDGWSKAANPSLECWRDAWPANVRGGSTYSCGLKKAAGTAEYYYHRVPARDAAQLWSKTITIRAYIKSPAGGGWRIFVNDSVSSIRFGSTVTTTGWAVAEFTTTIADGAADIDIGFEFSGAAGQCFYLSEPSYGVGHYFGGFAELSSFAPLRFIPIVGYAPPNWVNAQPHIPAVLDAAGTYSFLFDIYAETAGVLAPGIRMLHATLEGYNANAVATGAGGRVLAFRSNLSPPTTHGFTLFQQVQNIKTSHTGAITLAADGTARVYGVASDFWDNVSMDINGTSY